MSKFQAVSRVSCHPLRNKSLWTHRSLEHNRLSPRRGRQRGMQQGSSHRITLTEWSLPKYRCSKGVLHSFWASRGGSLDGNETSTLIVCKKVGNCRVLALKCFIVNSFLQHIFRSASSSYIQSWHTLLWLTILFCSFQYSTLPRQ